ncbi:ABC-2 type transport system permease protein [Natronoarchaeum philippinense]|uniref:ABC-2 type transport system permease protein n=1 Tax=Natronoarchaeum philippinense TaxID=558529 RepID=A0A285NUA9_NATPI|nr:ABC transporter permease subunit [Natronoarchaeum philippinense]SNZ12617.1 ABC-2 type transport system permease protein [Natronoarchaeum philippinense]
MFEITTFEAGRRLRGSLLLTVALLALIVLTVALFPSIAESGTDLDAYLESLPPEATRAFVGSVTTLTTIEGYLVSQLYQFGWVLLLAVYYAYAAASTVAGEIERGTIGMTLSMPVSRTRFVVGKFLSLLPGIVLVNAITFLGVYVGVVLIDESIDALDLFAVHAYSIAYLLACAGVGLLASVAFDSIRRAQTAGAGAVFGLFLLDTFTFDTDYDWLGDLALSRYFDPGEILADGEIAWGDLSLLLAAAVVLVVLSSELFERRDVSE